MIPEPLRALTRWIIGKSPSVLGGLLAVTALPQLGAQTESRVAFNRDVRPILSENCFYCHGQDAKNRQGSLRLDTLEGQKDTDSILPGHPERSSLIIRILSQDPDELMPPPGSNHRLSDRQKQTLQRWIAEGATFEKHWAFEAPKQSALPKLQRSDSTIVNPIDRFVLAKLDELEMEPAPEADRLSLLRRVSLDLIGLPPTMEEIRAFTEDESHDAYERVVDRLLRSPHYGERMSLPWLDAARYADTHGYQKDNLRTMWMWRDWVIEAFNSNMPFDQFTIEQLAGDLLPNPTIAQLIATGFNRNHRINGEAGAIDEEFRTEYVADRVETTSTVWLGLTIACARCHDHKFDPISQKEYYRLFAFFNNIEENGVDGVATAAVPTLEVKVPGFEQRILDAEQKIEAMQRQLVMAAEQLREERDAWERRITAVLHRPNGAEVWKLIEPLAVTSSEKMVFETLPDDSILASGPNPLNDVHRLRFSLPGGLITAIRLEALPHESHTQGSLARSFDGNFVLSGVDVEVQHADQPAKPIRIQTAIADYSQHLWPIADAIDDSKDTGWAVDGGRKAESREALFVFETPVKGDRGLEMIVTLRYESKEEQSLIGRFRLTATDLFEPKLVSMETLSTSLIEAILIDPAQRTVSQQALIDREFRERSLSLADLRGRIENERKQLSLLRSRAATSVMVMKESQPVRDTFVHLRGAYDKPGDRVDANVPECLSSIQPTRPLNRLDLARWLVQPSNPLAARVAVNRYWQMYFGRGLVATAEDFGTQGEWPSHPELLDWLALEFVRSGWDVKAMQRLIVTSATYRQSSRTLPDQLERDPENRYLSRGPRFRLPAQLLRDQALSASGLLVPVIGGPPVKPYQPDGLWEGVAGINSNTTVYRRDSGADLYRRSLYTFWKRAVPPPSMMLFDAADREVCSVKQRVTNTPLQALNLLNDITYVEAARVLATRVLHEKGLSTSQRIGRLWQYVLTRVPDEIEMKRLEAALSVYRRHFSEQPSNADSFIAIGETSVASDLDPITLAAWTSLAALVLNLDEALNKE